jgi:hypothetical protein
MEDRLLVRPCLLCCRPVRLGAPHSDWQKARANPGFRPTCPACGGALQQESAQTTGLDRAQLDLLEKADRPNRRL